MFVNYEFCYDRHPTECNTSTTWDNIKFMFENQTHSTWEVLSLHMVAECNIVTHFRIDSASLTQSTKINQSLLHLTINDQGQGLCLHSDTHILCIH